MSKDNDFAWLQSLSNDTLDSLWIWGNVVKKTWPSSTLEPTKRGSDLWWAIKAEVERRNIVDALPEDNKAKCDFVASLKHVIGTLAERWLDRGKWDEFARSIGMVHQSIHPHHVLAEIERRLRAELNLPDMNSAEIQVRMHQSIQNDPVTKLEHVIVEAKPGDFEPKDDGN